VLWKSHDVQTVQDAWGVCNTEGNKNGGELGKNGYIYLSSCNLVHNLRFVG
jgi:hypothetical protein